MPSQKDLSGIPQCSCTLNEILKRMHSLNAPLLFFLMIIFGHSLNAQSPRILKNYNLVFSDEFQLQFPTTIIQDEYWLRTPEWNQGTNKSGSMAWCVQDADSVWDKAYMIRDKSDSSTIKVSNGTCKLLTDSADYFGEIWNWPHGKFEVDSLNFKYRTGTLYSKQKFKFGYFEIRFRLPSPPEFPKNYQGFGPNFWLFGSDIPHGNYWSEIDVFEINACSPTRGINFYTSNLHYSDRDSSWHPTHYSEYGAINSAEWHIAGCLWTPKFIKLYLDQKLINKVKRSSTFPVDMLAPMNIIVDINSPATNFCTNFDPENTAFPYVYEIDYVRVYQRKN